MVFDIQLKTGEDFDGNPETFKQVTVLFDSGRKEVFAFEESKTEQEIIDIVTAALAEREA